MRTRCFSIERSVDSSSPSPINGEERMSAISSFCATSLRQASNSLNITGESWLAPAPRCRANASAMAQSRKNAMKFLNFMFATSTPLASSRLAWPASPCCDGSQAWRNTTLCVVVGSDCQEMGAGLSVVTDGLQTEIPGAGRHQYRVLLLADTPCAKHRVLRAVELDPRKESPSSSEGRTHAR